MPAQSQDNDASQAQIAQARQHLREWIWDRQTFNKQTVHFWREFEIPKAVVVTNATVYVTADNSYRLLLDGREIGRGSDWRTITEYDVTSLLAPGEHILAVDAFNDRLAAGLMFGMEIQMPKHDPILIHSDDSWKIVPVDKKNWEMARRASPDWKSAVRVGITNQAPWTPWPFAVVLVPPLQPLVYHFWQTLWFEAMLLVLLSIAVLACLWLLTQLTAQSKAQQFLQIERARIARDIHDDLGAQLTQLVLLGEVAQREQPAESPAREQFSQLCDRARELSRAMGEAVWAVNSHRDTVRDFVSYVCKYAGTFLADTPIRCRLDIESQIPALAFDLPVRRNLFLAVKEALNNAAKHSGANELFLRIRPEGEKLIVAVQDNGHGFDPAHGDGSGNGMFNMAERMSEIGGECSVTSQPGSGSVVTFTVPLEHFHRRSWFRPRTPLPSEIPGSISVNERRG